MAEDRNLVTCDLCGEQWRAPTEDVLLTHAWLRHPIEFFSSGKVIAMLGTLAREAGESAAEMLRGVRR